MQGTRQGFYTDARNEINGRRRKTKNMRAGPGENSIHLRGVRRISIKKSKELLETQEMGEVGGNGVEGLTFGILYTHKGMDATFKPCQSLPGLGL